MNNPSETSFPSNLPTRLAGFLFLVLIPYVTLFPHTSEPAWCLQDVILRWASIAVFLFAWGGLLFQKKSLPRGILDFPNLIFLLLTGWVFLSTASSEESFESFYAFKGFLAACVGWFSLRILWDQFPGLYPWFERVFFGTAVLAGAWLLLSTAGLMVWPDALPGVFPREGFFPNENIAAGFLGLALLWAGLKIFRGGSFSLPLFLLLFAAWGVTESRGAFLSMLLMGAVWMGVNRGLLKERIARWNFSKWTLLAGLILLGASGTFLMAIRLFHAADLDPRAGFRLELWKSAVGMIRSQPLLGFGPGVFGDVFPYYRPPSFWNVASPFAHNEYLQMAAECGLPALALTLLFLWALLKRTVSAAWRPLSPGNGASSSKAVECAFFLLLFEAAHNFVDFTFHEWSHRLVLLGFMTYALRQGPGLERQGKEGESFRSPAKMTRGLFVGLSLLLVWILGLGAYRDYRAWRGAFQGVLAQQKGDWDKAFASARDSLRFRENFFQSWNLLGFLEDAKAEEAKDGASRKNHFQLAQGYFQKAVQCSPYALDPKENQIQSKMKEGLWGEALELQTRLMEKGPEMPAFYLNEGRILMEMGRGKEALDPAQRMTQKFPYFLPGYFLKAQVLEKLGRKREAFQAYQAAQTMLQALRIPDPSGQVQPNLERLGRAP